MVLHKVWQLAIQLTTVCNFGELILASSLAKVHDFLFKDCGLANVLQDHGTAAQVTEIVINRNNVDLNVEQWKSLATDRQTLTDDFAAPHERSERTLG